MNEKGIFTRGQHQGKHVSDPSVSAGYLRMALWHGDFGSHIDKIIREELAARREVDFDATYNPEYREAQRKKKAQETARKQREDWKRANGSGYRAPALGGLSVDKAALAELVIAGRQALAKRHHPDVGGDTEKMKTINTAADAVLEWARK